MPWANVPESLWPEMEKCVTAVMNKTGKRKDAATAICYASVVGKEAQAEASLVVFKQANGQYRWVLLSSSAFKDRDGEIVSQAAQEADTDRMNATGDFGTLDWWHLVPQAISTREDLGALPTPVRQGGLILGDCDFSAMQDRIRVESGTFRDQAVAAAVATAAPRLAASLAFYHPLNEPDAQGVYHTIKTFSRALLPAGKESNLVTQLFVTQGGQMASLKEKWDAFVQLVGGEDTAQSIATQAAQKERMAEGQGLAFKEGATPKAGDVFTHEGATYVKSPSPLDPDGKYFAVKQATTEKAAYPFDQCLADQTKKYGSEETARKVCGSIRAKYGEASNKEANAPILLPPGVDFATALKEIETEMGVQVKADTTPPPAAPDASGSSPKLADLTVEQFAQAMAAGMQPMMDKMDKMMGMMGGMDTATAEAKETKATLASVAAELKEIKTTLAATAKTVQELNGDTARRGFRASTAKETEVTDPSKFKGAEPQADPLTATIEKFVLGGTAAPPA